MRNICYFSKVVAWTNFKCEVHLILITACWHQSYWRDRTEIFTQKYILSFSVERHNGVFDTIDFCCVVKKKTAYYFIFNRGKLQGFVHEGEEMIDFIHKTRLLYLVNLISVV